MKRLVFCLCLLASTAQAGEPRTFATDADEPTNGITIVVPNREIRPNELVKLPITGLTEEEFLRVSADATPSAGVTLELSMTLDRQPFLWFMAPAGATHNLRVVTNGQHQFWRQEFERGLAYAKSAKADEALIAEFTALIEKAEKAYPIRVGRAVISVSGPRPPPEPDPTPVPPLPTPGTGTVYAIVIRTVDTLNADQAKVLSDLRQWSDEQSTKVAHLEFPPDAVGPSGVRDPAVATWVSRIPATARQPYLFIAQKNAAGKMLIHWNGELPATAAEVIAKIKEHAQ